MGSINSIYLPNHMIDVICLTDIIQSQEINIIDDLHAMDKLSDIRLTDSDTKKAFYFHIINSICEHLDGPMSRPGDQVFYYSSCDLKFLELTSYISTHNVKAFLDTLTSHISKILPVHFYTSKKCFTHLKNVNSGETTNTVLEIKHACTKKRYNPVSFKRIQKFIKQQQFNYLDKKYFSKYKYMMKLV